MNKRSIYYAVIDKTQLMTTRSKHASINDAFHEILKLVDTALSIFILNNIEVNPPMLNFSNYECVECLTESTIVNVYKFNITELCFIDIRNIKYHVQDPRFTYITNNIYSKLKQLKEKKTPHLAKPSINKLAVKENPIKSLLDETNKIIVNTNTSTNINNTRKIPTINIKKEESDDELDDNSDDENETTEQLTKQTVSDLDLSDFPRQMNSIIVDKKTSNDLNIIDDLNQDNIDINKLNKTMEELKKIKEAEKKKLEDLKKITNDDLFNFSEYCSDLGDRKRTLRREKEREEEKRNRYEANKSAYRKIKSDIECGKINEEKISELFVKEYPIYKFMDQQNLLDKEDEYTTYVKLYNEMYPEINKETVKEGYVPHNINYLSTEEQDKYKNDSKKDDMIDEFIKNENDKIKEKKYPPMEKIFELIDNGEQVTSNKNTKQESESQNSNNNSEDDDIDIDVNNVSFENAHNEKLDLIENALKLNITN
ncbi:hypothetical protein QKU48_gp0626 [Fadolivirus algeromassiliense]|jgi:sRNA-binding regulator protein Hfq|uniref:Uncharacterized protein n=1 Tax=Fadolivirus FV1/VV64 TaxID=3070911 RepID=A0A7D3QV90_9VIRU|nr:hypothetical protein QKU48_gp0626 [Fadolivirus algeromassiliense]QKF94084.1 hypothetical protein Fadolivirus_1_626 [Fadolivirus FV1/VV64]